MTYLTILFMKFLDTQQTQLNHPEIALESEPVTEQPKANTEGEGENEEEGAVGEEEEDGEADGEDSEGESEGEEEGGGCCSCCNKASSSIFIFLKKSIKNVQFSFR